MAILQYLRRLYSLDTLDTRLTVPSSTSLKAAAVVNTNKQAHDDGAQSIANATPPPRWKTPEFFFYYFIFITVVPLMFKTVIDVSQESHPTYPLYSHLLSPGWVPGRKVDNSDVQYSGFRDNVPYLLLLVVFHPLLRRAYAYVSPIKPESPGNGSNPSATATAIAADARLEQRTNFDYYFALIFIIALHGMSSLKILFVLYINYKIAKEIPRSYVPGATWTFNLVVLFANELYDGYPLENILKLLTSGQHPSLISWGQWLDGFGGLMPRWQILFKVTILRLISFNMDYYWSLHYTPNSSLEKKQLDPGALSERDRVSVSADPSSYNYRYYVAYVLYSPLYLVGPILSFNDYISQQRYPPLSVNRTRTLLYGIRFLLTFLCMELVLHYIYAVAISKAHPDWSMYTPGELSMLGYFNLHIIWLKLLIPWRFFRLWALIDGIDPPENMVRCMSDNYSAKSFWRSWHRSFHRWSIRYLYIPLGGAGSRTSRNNGQGSTLSGSTFNGSPNKLLTRARGVFNTLVVFMFVAVWHDINLRLLMWGWLITLFVLPEIIAGLLFPASRFRSHPTTYRVLCGFGAVLNILMMMAANLVGFALGIDGLKGLLAGIFDSLTGVVFTIAACGALFVGVQVMFEVRESEHRKGIDLKC